MIDDDAALNVLFERVLALGRQYNAMHTGSGSARRVGSGGIMTGV